MQIRIAARHGHLSDASQAKLSAKFEKLARHNDRLMSIDVTVDLEHKESPRVDVCVKAEHAQEFVANEQAGELMAAVDGVLHKLERQLKKHKEKVQDRHRTKDPQKNEELIEDEPEAERE